jgi:PITH domain-containing protein
MCRCGGADEHVHGERAQPPQVKNLRPLVTNAGALNYTLAVFEDVLDILDLAKATSTSYIISSADDQLMIKVSFSGPVKLRDIQLIPHANHSPTTMRAYVNQDTLDFSSLSRATLSQGWTLLGGSAGEMVEYPTRPFKFSNVSHLTLLFENKDAAKSALCYIGLMGEISGPRAAVQTSYELRPNPALHKTGGLFDSVQARNLQ